MLRGKQLEESSFEFAGNGWKIDHLSLEHHALWRRYSRFESMRGSHSTRLRLAHGIRPASWEKVAAALGFRRMACPEQA